MKNIIHSVSLKTNTLIATLLFASLFLGGFSIQAQTTEGTDFWVTFGQNHYRLVNEVTLQIRIVSRDISTSGNIYFTHLDTAISFSIGPREVYTYNLNDTQKQAVYNTLQGVLYSSIHITTNNPVVVYALNQSLYTTDATNIFPVTTLGADYYQISYSPRKDILLSDAYAVIATENNTQVFHNGGTPITLNAGQVYYRIAYQADMTGAHITANKPVAFFALNQSVRIPNADGNSGDHFMQQLAPVSIWGKNFFVPVSDLTTSTDHDTKDRVRVVASQNNTVITPPTGVTLITNTGGQNGYTLQVGQFIELEVTLNNNGCFIQANKPVGVCTYLTSLEYNNRTFSDPAQAWLPSIEQTFTEALVAPFVASGNSTIEKHYALLFTPTVTKDSTRVSIGGGTPTSLSKEKWRDHVTAGYSFYSMPLTNQTASYNFTNNAGLVVMGYGVGDCESYYYLAYSAMRNLDTSYHVTVEVNEPNYGYASGTGDYLPNATATAEAFANSCYRFSHWTINDKVVSEDNPYSFKVTEDITLVAHFYALDFDTYCPTLWDNTFMLNLRKLREEGYEVTGCKWFKNGLELTETNTIDEFSYSAGPNEGNLLELEPTRYMFELLTDNFGSLCSSKKTMTGYSFNKLIVYPNPVQAGVSFTVAGTEKEHFVNVYNYYGACVGSIMGEEGIQKLTLDLPTGIYFIRSNNKTAKIVIVK